MPEAPPPPPRQSDGDGEQRPSCSGFGCPPTEITVARQLLASGPDTTEIYGTFESPAHQFAVVGFVKDGWPLSVEYVAEPGTVTILRVKLYHQRKILIFPVPFFEVAFQANLDALEAETESDNPWHRTVKIDRITLSREADPAAADGGLHVARYELRSYRFVDGQVDRKQRAPLNVIGLTVGPEVVGSITLRGALFDNARQRIPAADNPPTELGFRYRTDTNYDLIKERIERYSDRELSYSVAKLLGTPHSATAGQVFSSSWRLGRRLAPGRYRASIIAWWRCQGVTILDRMNSCPNNPNWAVTNSGDVELHR